MKKQAPIWEKLMIISEMKDHDIVIERIAAQALEEARKAANAARRSIGQILRRDREKQPA